MLFCSKIFGVIGSDITVQILREWKVHETHCEGSLLGVYSIRLYHQEGEKRAIYIAT